MFELGIVKKDLILFSNKLLSNLSDNAPRNYKYINEIKYIDDGFKTLRLITRNTTEGDLLCVLSTFFDRIKITNPILFFSLWDNIPYLSYQFNNDVIGFRASYFVEFLHRDEYFVLILFLRLEI